MRTGTYVSGSLSGSIATRTVAREPRMFSNGTRGPCVRGDASSSSGLCRCAPLLLPGPSTHTSGVVDRNRESQRSVLVFGVDAGESPTLASVGAATARRSTSRPLLRVLSAVDGGAR